MNMLLPNEYGIPTTPGTHDKIKNENYCKSHYKDFYNDLIVKYTGLSYIEALYLYYHNDKHGICLVCGNRTRFINFNKGYSSYCCAGCASKDPNIKNKKIQTTLKNYGVENPSQSGIIKNRIKSTLLQRYGDSCFNNRDKYKQTNLERYGVENPSQSDVIKDKTKQTNLERYGTEWVMQNQDILKKSNITYNALYGGRGNSSVYIKEKVKKTNLERYGVENPSQSKAIKEKVKKTNLERYGTEYVFQSDIIKEKIKKTNIERYGTEYASQSEIVKEKTKQTNLERYGTENIFRSEVVKEKIKQTNLERYGTEYASQSDVVKEKAKQTNLERYGTEYASQSDIVKEKVKQTNIKKYIEHPNSTLPRYPNLKDIIYQNGERYYVIDCGDCNQCTCNEFLIKAHIASNRISNNIELCPIKNPLNTISNTKIEKFITNILDKHNIEYIQNDREILNGKELDIYIPSKNIAIECNGIYWHSDKIKDNTYHINKFKLCEDRKIQLITIWEDQIINNPDIIESILLSKLGIYQERIYARKCVIKEIDSKECNEFLQKYHLQGKINSSIRLGLYYHDKLYAAMVFGKSRNCMKGSGMEYELYRYCCVSDIIVVGGASKLFKFFIKNYNPSSVISFSSNDISIGGLYKTLGFKKISDTIGYWYIDSKYNRYHRYTFTKHKLVEMGYDINKSEKCIMNELGYLRIYDSGQTKWEYCMLNTPA